MHTTHADFSAIMGPAAPASATDRKRTRADSHYDVLVIGAGQAGLAAAYWLRQTGLRFLLLERHRRLGTSWRERYDSLRLFSSRRLSALPGAALAGEPDGFPTKDELGNYLEYYARAFALPISLDEGVISARHPGGGHFVLRTSRGRTLTTAAMIIATGPFHRAKVPAFASGLSPDLVQLTAERYRNPRMVPGGRVLVVGAGATGRQVAAELSADRDVALAVGRGTVAAPARVFGREVLAWTKDLGVLTADKRSLVGRILQQRDSFPGWHLRLGALRRRGIQILDRAVGGRLNQIYFADGRRYSFDAVIWATGYRDDFAWLRVDKAFAADGRIRDDLGCSPVPGVFFVGRRWQKSQASALLCGVGDDAHEVVRSVRSYLATAVAARSQTPSSGASLDDGDAGTRSEL